MLFHESWIGERHRGLAASAARSFAIAWEEEIRGFEDKLRMSKDDKGIIWRGGIELVRQSGRMQLFVLQAGDVMHGHIVYRSAVLCWLDVGWCKLAKQLVAKRLRMRWSMLGLGHFSSSCPLSLRLSCFILTFCDFTRLIVDGSLSNPDGRFSRS